MSAFACNEVVNLHSSSAYVVVATLVEACAHSSLRVQRLRGCGKLPCEDTQLRCPGVFGVLTQQADIPRRCRGAGTLDVVAWSEAAEDRLKMRETGTDMAVHAGPSEG